MNRKELYRIVADLMDETTDDIGHIAKTVFKEMTDRLSLVEILVIVTGMPKRKIEKNLKGELV